MDFIEEIRRYIPIEEQEKQIKSNILHFLEIQGYNSLNRTSSMAHMTATAMILNPKKDKVLMIHHNIFDTWACIGGHADGEENLFLVAQKEAEEEAGITELVSTGEGILSLDTLFVKEHWKNGIFIPNHLHLNATYGFIVEETAPLTIKEDEVSDVKWIKISEIGSACKEKEFVMVYHKILKKLLNDNYYQLTF